MATSPDVWVAPGVSLSIPGVGKVGGCLHPLLAWWSLGKIPGCVSHGDAGLFEPLIQQISARFLIYVL